MRPLQTSWYILRKIVLYIALTFPKQALAFCSDVHVKLEAVLVKTCTQSWCNVFSAKALPLSVCRPTAPCTNYRYGLSQNLVDPLTQLKDDLADLAALRSARGRFGASTQTEDDEADRIKEAFYGIIGTVFAALQQEHISL